MPKDGMPTDCDKRVFVKWEVLSGNVKLENPKNYFTSFVMGEEDVSIKAVYAKIPKEGTKVSYKGNTYKVAYNICKCGPEGMDDDGNPFDGIVELSLSKIKTGTTNLVIPDYFTKDNITYRVSEIENCKLAGNKTLKSVKLPTTLINVGYGTFKGCSNLKKITISGKDKISDVELFCLYSTGAFENISKKAVIYVPKKQLKAFKKYLRHKYYDGSVVEKTTTIKGK